MRQTRLILVGDTIQELLNLLNDSRILDKSLPIQQLSKKINVVLFVLKSIRAHRMIDLGIKK